MTRFRQGYSVASEGRGNSIADCSAKRVAILLQFTTEITEHTEDNNLFSVLRDLRVLGGEILRPNRQPPFAAGCGRIEHCSIIS